MLKTGNGPSQYVVFAPLLFMRMSTVPTCEVEGQSGIAIIPAVLESSVAVHVSAAVGSPTCPGGSCTTKSFTGSTGQSGPLSESVPVAKSIETV